MYRCQDTAPASTGTDVHFLRFFKRNLSMNCEYLMNGVSLSRDFFHVYTIDYGLSSRAIKSAPTFFFFALHPLPAREDMFGQIR